MIDKTLIWCYRCGELEVGSSTRSGYCIHCSLEIDRDEDLEDENKG